MPGLLLNPLGNSYPEEARRRPME